MHTLTTLAVEAALAAGASYADARIVASDREKVKTKNGRLDGIVRADDRGLGVRVIADGCWGFAAAADLTPAAVAATAQRAVAVARASAAVGTAGVPPAGRLSTHAAGGTPAVPGDLALAPVPPAIAEWHSPCAQDPFAVPLEDKLALLMDLDRRMRATPDVNVAEAEVNSFRTLKWFASSVGSCIYQETVECGGLLQATAVGGGEVQTRSFPSALEGFHGQAGWEVFSTMDWQAGAETIGREAVQLLTAPLCPSGVMDIILDGSQLALQVHESCGHPTELDRVFGSELSLAGGSFLQPDWRGRRYGSDLVTITADATTPGGLGTFAYDDEGAPATRTVLVDKGIFTGYQSSRETAAQLGITSSSAGMRADGWGAMPLIRMTNINLEPGTTPYADLIASTERGLLLQETKSWSIDDLRLNFQFSTEKGYLIENGRLTTMVRNPSYQGITPDFWASCDAIADRDHYRIWGVLNCGKGDPMQTMHVGHGASAARFRGVKVGIG
jgi:TldD protein